MPVHVYTLRPARGMCSISLLEAAQAPRTGSQSAGSLLLCPGPAALRQRRHRLPGGEQGTELLMI